MLPQTSSGLSRQEAAQLRRDQVDLMARTLTILDTKNREQHTLPLSDFLYTLLLRRTQKTTCQYVFPGAGAGGYIIEPRKQMPKSLKTQALSLLSTIYDEPSLLLLNHSIFQPSH